MSLKFDIFEINDLARVVPADMEITTFTGILWWAAALVDGRAAAEPSEPMSLPREPEAVGAGDDAFRLVEPDEPTETVTVVLETAADAGVEAAVADAAAAAIAAIAASGDPAPATIEPHDPDEGSPSSADAAEPAPVAEPDDVAADPAPAVSPEAVAEDLPARPTSPLVAIWSKADDKRLVEMWDAGSPDAEIAAELQRSARAVQNRLARLRKSGEFGPLAVRKPGRPVPVPEPAPQLETRAAATTTEPTPSAAPAVMPPAASRLPAAARTIYEHLARLDDSFTPGDDLDLIRKRQAGATMEAIAEDLGSDVAAVRDRWRAILKCKVESKGGIVTPAGHESLLSAATLRASA